MVKCSVQSVRTQGKVTAKSPFPPDQLGLGMQRRDGGVASQNFHYQFSRTGQNLLKPTSVVNPNTSEPLKLGSRLLASWKICGRERHAVCISDSKMVDHERIQAVGPDRAASEWLLRCGASVRYHGYDKWQQDYNAIPMGPLEKYKIQAINATESCIMNKGFDYFDGLKHLEEIKFCKCMYIEDACLQRISETPSLQKSLLRLFLISCGNVTDKGIIALHKLSNLEYLFLSDLPGIRDKERTVQSLKKSMPALELELDLE